LALTLTTQLLPPISFRRRKMTPAIRLLLMFGCSLGGIAATAAETTLMFTCPKSKDIDNDLTAVDFHLLPVFARLCIQVRVARTEKEKQSRNVS
jgi:hypothetical protein